MLFRASSVSGVCCQVLSAMVSCAMAARSSSESDVRYCAIFSFKAASWRDARPGSGERVTTARCGFSRRNFRIRFSK